MAALAAWLRALSSPTSSHTRRLTDLSSSSANAPSDSWMRAGAALAPFCLRSKALSRSPRSFEQRPWKLVSSASTSSSSDMA
eukprot:627829-Prymnesium_polylepis.2